MRLISVNVELGLFVSNKYSPFAFYSHFQIPHLMVTTGLDSKMLSFFAARHHRTLKAPFLGVPSVGTRNRTMIYCKFLEGLFACFAFTFPLFPKLCSTINYPSVSVIPKIWVYNAVNSPFMRWLFGGVFYLNSGKLLMF